MRKLDDPELVSSEYESGEAHAVRLATFRDYREGPDADDVALAAVAESGPARVLEVGCGDGSFAARMRAELGCDVVALDITERGVRLAHERGVEAVRGDVQELPFEDAAFDCVVAKWMLYHVPDLDRGLAEIARVLRPGGRLVAVTLSDIDLPELWRLVGAEPSRGVLSFSQENGAESLARHFDPVERRDIENFVAFPDPEAARRYVAASMTRAHLADRVPDFDGPLRARAACTVFVAHVAR